MNSSWVKKQVETAIACLNLQKDQRPLCLLLHAPGIGFRHCQHKRSWWIFCFQSILVIKTFLFLTKTSQETRLSHLHILAEEDSQREGQALSRVFWEMNESTCFQLQMQKQVNEILEVLLTGVNLMHFLLTDWTYHSYKLVANGNQCLDMQFLFWNCNRQAPWGSP